MANEKMVNLVSFLKENTLEVTFRSRKAGKETVVDINSLPIESVIAIAQYGAQRFINDKLGGSEVGEKDAAKMYDKILKQLQDGWEGRQRGEGVDPVETRAMRLAKDQVKAAILAKGIKLKDVGKEKLDKLAKDLFEKNADAYRKQAAELIEAEKAAKENAASEVDLSALGLDL